MRSFPAVEDFPLTARECQIRLISSLVRMNPHWTRHAFEHRSRTHINIFSPLSTSNSSGSGVEIQGGNKNPFSLAPSSRIISSRVESFRVETGSFRFAASWKAGCQDLDFLICSALEIKSLHFASSCCFSRAEPDSLTAFR